MIIGDDINLAIFSSEWGNREGDEEEKIIYFYPQSLEIKEQIKIVGLADAFVKFSCSFGREQECKFIICPTNSQIFYLAEDRIWILLKLLSGLTKINEIRSSLRAILRKAYNEFKLIHGTFLNTMQETGATRQFLNKQIFPFFNQFVQSFTTFNFTFRNLMVEELKCGEHESVLPCREPLERLSFLELQADLASLEALYCGQGLIHSLLTCRDKSIIWSSMDESTASAISDLTTLVDCIVKASNTVDASPLGLNDSDYTLGKNDTPNSTPSQTQSQQRFGRFLPLKLTFHPSRKNKSADDRTLEVYLSANSHASPYVLVAYQIFSYCIALIFDKNALSHALSQEGESFFSALGSRLGDRLGKKYLHERRNSLPTPVPLSGSDSSKVLQNMSCLVINEGHNTFRSSVEPVSLGEKGPNPLPIPDYYLIFSRLNYDIQGFPPGSDMTVKLILNKNTYWFLARSAWPKRSMLIFSNKSTELASTTVEAIRKEAFQRLAQI